jgi:creatinine amidohydrolase
MKLSERPASDAPANTDRALLPVGSTEQHGPHLPLGTDTIAAEAVAEAGAAALDEPVPVGPTIEVGISAEHRHFKGTVWVSPDTFRAQVRETVKSLATQGFERVVLVNGHGGNVAALREVCAQLSRDGGAYAVPCTWFDAIEAPDMGHGGPVETSLLMHVAPELVEHDQLEAAADGGADAWGEWVGGINLAYDSAEFTANGVVGDPTDASADRGAELLEAAGERLATVLDAIADRPLEAAERTQ